MKAWVNINYGYEVPIPDDVTQRFMIDEDIEVIEEWLDAEWNEDAEPPDSIDRDVEIIA